MSHWMEGDWPDPNEDTPEVKAVKRLLQVSKDVIAKCTIEDDPEGDLIGEFDDAIAELESIIYPEDDDPRSMGWVGYDGLP